MNVTLKLYASLGSFLPSEARRNAIQLSLPEEASVMDLLARYHVPREACHLVLINGRFTPPRQIGEQRLHDGDVVAIWPPVAGG